MRILISGASGFIGAPLSFHFTAQGHEVVRLTRSLSQNPRAISWDPEKGRANRELFEGFDAVIHLAGDPLSLARWDEAKKNTIFGSRVNGTRFLCSILSSLKDPPRVFVSASAIGIYGNRGEEMLDEKSSPGSGFLSRVCTAWEASSQLLEDLGIRVIHTRFGMVLGSGGGSLSKMLPIYKWGLGSVLGTGRQWMSWISLPDLVHAIDHVITFDMRGAVNFVSPDAIRQEDFSRMLARLLYRPHVGKIPAFVLRMCLGEVADELILSSAHVLPTKLLESGFLFKYPHVKEALLKCIE